MRITFFILLAFLTVYCQGQITDKPRIIVTTDGEVDDRSSFIRFLLYTSDFNTEGIIATNSKWQKNGHGLEWINEALDLYAAIWPNLILHHSGYPTAENLKSVLVKGNENPAFLTGVPPYQDTPGSELILSKLLDNDSRPVHVNCWGGANTVAQSLYKLKNEYSGERYKKAVSKIRIYCISFQDEAGNWIRDHVKEAMIIQAGSWYQTWNYHPQEHNPYPDYMSEDWLIRNVKTGHGAFGAWYPQKNVSEGDTPAFLPLVNNGLRAYKDYSYGGWGGRFVPAAGNHWVDAKDQGDTKKAIYRWCIATQNDFEARMDWTAMSYADANHHPVIVLKPLTSVNIKPGDEIILNATNSRDPDQDELEFLWWNYKDAGNLNKDISISKAQSRVASFVVPDDSFGTFHIILELTDNGNPQLKTYLRIIFNVK